MKKINFKDFFPPIFLSIYQKLFHHNPPEDPNSLFDGDDQLFKNTVSLVTIYGEYGCGKSTKWVLNNTESKVIAIDTSENWVNEVISDTFENNSRLDIKYVDLGELGNWGRPLSYIKSEAFSRYTDYIWLQENKPEVVLIDGRFRVCCFLTTLKLAEPGTKILFDDYTDRPYYHFVEKYTHRVEECGRQCLFVVPSKEEIDIASLDEDINKFRYVMD